MENNNTRDPFWFGIVKGALQVSLDKTLSEWAKKVGHKNVLMADCVRVVEGWKAIQPEREESHTA